MIQYLPSMLILAVLMTAVPNIANASLVGTDDASAYGGGWTNGSDGSTSGDAFGAWTLNAGGGGAGGRFIGNSTNLSGGSGANINSSGNSFGMFANGSPTAFSTATRGFNGALSIGDTFSLDLAVNFRNGNKGFNLRNASNTNIFNFNVGSDDYAVNSAATGNGTIGNAFSTNTAFNLSFTQLTLTGGTWQITRSGGVSDLDSGTYSGLGASFELYISGTDGGSANDLFANNLSVTAVPEPSSLVLVAGCSVAFLVRRRRQRASV